ncbi:pimeloyl-ACP methyl ester carboxylesterase [Pseudoduganella flava]|uniref:Pimeloyl-ACP methyl ester carboxylesterase n=1 Tax=Pseudoduganella flava TaxID=871742 RepID=A0A562PF10_9BURK|nr:alpha/beta fold hydrolase [Pseudoduganella flava]TWI42998.1 pimeloyl-ACP methyl ester carboxylesterase [Pseudoduganella flava]
MTESSELYHEWIAGEAVDGHARPVLVFLHEGLGSVSMWKDFPRRLCAATGCPGLVYDRQGYGRSPALTRRRTVHYLHDYALAELPAVLAALLPERDYVLFGHSDGGSIALLHAAEAPARLRGIVTLAAHVMVEQVTLDGIAAAAAAWEAGKLAGLARHHGDKTAALFHAWADTWRSPGFAHWHIGYALPSIACPVLALQGRDDQYGTPAQLDAIEAGVRGARTVLLDDCGHAPHVDQPARVLELAGAFIAAASA